MQVRQLALEQHVVMVRAGDVARPTCAGAARIQCRMHRANDGGVLPHAEIVVGAPDRHFLRAAIGMARRARKGAAVAFQFSEDAVAPFAVEPIDLLAEVGLVVHGFLHSE